MSIKDPKLELKIAEKRRLAEEGEKWVVEPRKLTSADARMGERGGENPQSLLEFENAPRASISDFHAADPATGTAVDANARLDVHGTAGRFERTSEADQSSNGGRESSGRRARGLKNASSKGTSTSNDVGTSESSSPNNSPGGGDTDMSPHADVSLESPSPTTAAFSDSRAREETTGHPTASTKAGADVPQEEQRQVDVHLIRTPKAKYQREDRGSSTSTKAPVPVENATSSLLPTERERLLHRIVQLEDCSRGLARRLAQTSEELCLCKATLDKHNLSTVTGELRPRRADDSGAANALATMWGDLSRSLASAFGLTEVTTSPRMQRQRRAQQPNFKAEPQAERLEKQHQQQSNQERGVSRSSGHGTSTSSTSGSSNKRALGSTAAARVEGLGTLFAGLFGQGPYASTSTSSRCEAANSSDKQEVKAAPGENPNNHASKGERQTGSGTLSQQQVDDDSAADTTTALLEFVDAEATRYAMLEEERNRWVSTTNDTLLQLNSLQQLLEVKQLECDRLKADKNELVEKSKTTLRDEMRKYQQRIRRAFTSSLAAGGRPQRVVVTSTASSNNMDVNTFVAGGGLSIGQEGVLDLGGGATCSALGAMNEHRDTSQIGSAVITRYDDHEVTRFSEEEGQAGFESAPNSNSVTQEAESMIETGFGFFPSARLESDQSGKMIGIGNVMLSNGILKLGASGGSRPPTSQTEAGLDASPGLAPSTVQQSKLQKEQQSSLALGGLHDVGSTEQLQDLVLSSVMHEIDEIDKEEAATIEEIFEQTDWARLLACEPLLPEDYDYLQKTRSQTRRNSQQQENSEGFFAAPRGEAASAMEGDASRVASTGRTSPAATSPRASSSPVAASGSSYPNTTSPRTTTVTLLDDKRLLEVVDLSPQARQSASGASSSIMGNKFDEEADSSGAQFELVSSSGDQGDVGGRSSIQARKPSTVEHFSMVDDDGDDHDE
ncbi:unnamed protein product [Amoebophrya sp. A25]|nr:unnamed protein product [Amoebophrya sp. A25]|eukprot:GSA25T00000676001.1